MNSLNTVYHEFIYIYFQGLFSMKICRNPLELYLQKNGGRAWDRRGAYAAEPESGVFHEENTDQDQGKGLRRRQRELSKELEPVLVAINHLTVSGGV